MPSSSVMWPSPVSVLCLMAQSCPNLCKPMDCSPPGSSIHRDSPGKNTGVGCHALLQGIFSALGSNPGLLHCRQILYHLSYQGSPRILEWAACPFSRGSSWPRNPTQVSCIAFFTSWATGEAPAMNNHFKWSLCLIKNEISRSHNWHTKLPALLVNLFIYLLPLPSDATTTWFM